MKGCLQQALSEAVSELPRIFFEGIIERKLVEAGIEVTKEQITEISEAVMAGKSDKFAFDHDGEASDVVISLTEDDADEVESSIRDFCESELPKLVEDLSKQTARSIVRRLKKDWPEQYAWDHQIKSAFRERLAIRWGDALHVLGMLLTVSRELGEEMSRKHRRSRAKRGLHRREVLLRLHARACQVTGEILTLMEAGYADGAMARWRTLHEVCTVATVIAENDNELTERYMAHEAVEAKRALEVFL